MMRTLFLVIRRLYPDAGKNIWIKHLKKYNPSTLRHLIVSMVSDWFLSESYKEGQYVLGLGVVVGISDSLKNAIIDSIQKAVVEKFTKNYIKEHDRKPHSHLFEVKIATVGNKCELVEWASHDIQNDDSFDNTTMKGELVDRQVLLNNTPCEYTNVY